MFATQIEERVVRVRAVLRDQGLDALLVSQPESRYYLSGYKGHDQPPRDSAGYLVITQDRLLLLTDPRTTEQAANEAPGCEVVEVRSGIAEALPPLAADVALRRIGFEGIHLPYHLTDQIRGGLGDRAEFRETVGLIDALRAGKDELELATMRAAIAVSDACVDYLIGWLRPGSTEKEVAWEVERFIRTHGAQDVAFDTIAASGPNAALPHAIPTDRRIAAGEPIVIDMGAKVNQYSSDITRMLCLGAPPEWLEKVYAIVLEAQVRAEELVGAGMTGREADGIARAVITDAGYGEYFRHGLGHGIGLEVHEPPRLSALSGDVLQQGMVFSVEPGIYLSGTGGVRIEDLAWLGPNGIEVLTRAPKDKRLLRI